MDLYIHVDRGRQLASGDVIELERYRREESRLMLLAPCLDAEFVRHLERLMEEGISLHGAQYLLMPQQKPDFDSMAIELAYEAYRAKHCPEQPSRLQAFFAFADIADAVRFCGDTSCIYRVRSQAAAHKYDMNALKLSYDPQQQEAYAARYWRGEPLSMDATYQPQWEILLTLPVEIVSRV